MDHASFFSEATLTEIGVFLFIQKNAMKMAKIGMSLPLKVPKHTYMKKPYCFEEIISLNYQ